MTARQAKYRRTIKITVIRFVEVTSVESIDAKFRLTDVQHAEAVALAEVDPLSVDDVHVTLVQEVP